MATRSRSRRGRPASRGPWALAALALALLWALPRPAHGETLLDRYRIHPAYDTSYEVNREQNTWRQKLALDRRIVVADFKGQLEVMRKEDTRRNDYDQTQRKLNVNAERKQARHRFFTTAIVDRDRVDQTISSRQVDRDNVTLGTESSLYTRGQTFLKLLANGGLVRNHEFNIRRRTNGYVVDSTDASGLLGGAGLNGSYDGGPTLKMTGDLKLDLTAKDSKSVHEEVTGANRVSTPKSATDRDRQVIANYTATWTHFEEAKVQLKGVFSDASTQYYQASQQDQETRLTQRREASVLIEGDVTPALYYSLNLAHKFSLLDYELEKRDRQTRDTDLAVEAGYKITSVPIIAGTDLVWGLTTGEGETRVENGNNYTSERATMSGELTHPFGPKLSVTATTELLITQDFYDDPTQDQDQLTERFNVSGRYTPSESFKGSLNYRVDNRETIKIAKEVSAGNLEQEDYAVVAEYTAKMYHGIQASQSFQVQASYQSYTFTAEENSLARTNRLASKLDVPLLDRTMMLLRHDFLKTDSGSYIYDEEGGGRAYAREVDRLQQKLQALVIHDITPDIYVKADERYEITYTTAASTGAQTRIDKLTFTWEFGFEKKFPSGFKVSAVVARTASTQEDDYWNIRADAGMKF